MKKSRFADEQIIWLRVLVDADGEGGPGGFSEIYAYQGRPAAQDVRGWVALRGRYR